MSKLKIILGGIVLVLLFTGFEVIRFQEKQLKKLRNDVEAATTLADKNATAAKTYINLHGREVSKNKVLSLTLTNTRKLRQIEELQFINQFNGVKKNLGNLQQVVKVQASVIQSLKLTNTDTIIIRTPGDTVRASKFGYLDAYNFIKGHTAGDTTYIDTLRFNVPIEGGVIAGRRTKKFLFFRVGPRQLESHITSPNPWVKIQDHLIIKVEK